MPQEMTDEERPAHAHVPHSSLHNLNSTTLELSAETVRMDHKKQAPRPDPNPTTPPKLTLNSLPSVSKRAEAWTGVATPPFRLAGVVPFRWEEEPGRPKFVPSRETAAADADMCLELPPRLSASAKVVNPNKLTNSSCFLIRRTSFGRERRGGKFTSSEKSSSPNSSASSSSSSFPSFKSYSSASASSYSVGGEESEGEAEEEQRKVRILRYRKKRISASHLWAGIIVRLKQAVIVPHRKERDPSI